MRRRRRTGGFSILEVLAATALFAVVAAAVSALATTSVRFTIDNRHGTAAAMLAQEELEDLRGMAFEDVESRARSEIVGGQAFTITTVVDDDDPEPGMKHIVVTISWGGPRGVRTHAIETIFTSLL